MRRPSADILCCSGRCGGSADNPGSAAGDVCMSQGTADTARAKSSPAERNFGNWPRFTPIRDGAGSAAGNTARGGRWTDVVVRSVFGPGAFGSFLSQAYHAQSFAHAWGEYWGGRGNRFFTERDFENLPRHNFYGLRPAERDPGMTLRLEPDPPMLRAYGVVDPGAMSAREIAAQEIAARELYPDLFFRPIAGIAANINDERKANEDEAHDDK